MLILFKNIFIFGCAGSGFALAAVSRGRSPVAVSRLLVAVAFPVTEHRPWVPGPQWLQHESSVVVAPGLFSCTWSLPGPVIEPLSPALTGRFLPTVPPGRSRPLHLKETRQPGLGPKPSESNAVSATN